MTPNFGVVILAAGKGTRLGCVDRPKVMLDLNGRPMVDYTVETLEQLGFSSEAIVLVVGFQKEVVIDHFGDRVTFAHQQEQLGTAHAAYTGMLALPKEVERVLVMGGDDSAFYTPEMLRKLIQNHVEGNQFLTLLTAEMEDPRSLGRIIRHANGQIEIVEKESLTEEQKRIKEISTGTFVFNRAWFENIFPTMPKMEKLGEFGLPTALAIVREMGLAHQVVKLENVHEWFGVNTPEELEEARKRKFLSNT
jgi:bifunctional UDP-N-acetylglucosamine pyrophosphorylase/glucosamine-1-phosphate N-acetyltransferase